jgi:hypothetical protein
LSEAWTIVDLFAHTDSGNDDHKITTCVNAIHHKWSIMQGFFEPRNNIRQETVTALVDRNLMAHRAAPPSAEHRFVGFDRGNWDGGCYRDVGECGEGGRACNLARAYRASDVHTSSMSGG